MIYNVKYSTEPILIVAGDAVDFWLNIEEWDSITGEWYGKDVGNTDFVFKVLNKHGTEIASWSTVGGELLSWTEDGAIIIPSHLHVLAAAIDIVSCCGSFDGHLYIASPQKTMWKGLVKIT